MQLHSPALVVAVGLFLLPSTALIYLLLADRGATAEGSSFLLSTFGNLGD